MSVAPPGLARRTRRSLLVLLGAIVAFLPGVGAVAEATTGGSASLQASKPGVISGGWVGFSGSVSAADPCRSGREVRLRSVEPGSHGHWVVLHTGATDDQGAFRFGARPANTARYQAYLPATPTCDAIGSRPLVTVTVAARVTLIRPMQGIPAGSCGRVSVEVEPPKPGTTVAFQRLVGSSWSTVSSPTLDSSSKATAQRCGGWADIGTQPWRATWSHGTDPLNTDGTSPKLPVPIVEAKWMRHIDQLAGGRNVGVTVADRGTILYERADTVMHVPASNEKLLQSMALLSRLGADATVITSAKAASVTNGGVVPGNLWLIGRGDPAITKKRMAQLARAVAKAGIKAVRGSVKGSVSYFAHDWFAPGWRSDFPADQVALPTALTYRGNVANGRSVAHPELRAARAFTRMLRADGVAIHGRPGEGVAPGSLHRVAWIASPSLRAMLRRQNVDSVNFDAEVLGKVLGVVSSGVPGTIAKGASAIAGFARAHGVWVRSLDSSGLSYRDLIAPRGMVRLLTFAETSAWGGALRSTLATPGKGTLEDRLAGIPVVAKTGTLDNLSALSGWVRLSRSGRWVAFSIMSGGFDPSLAKDMEDGMVSTLFRYGH